MSFGLLTGCVAVPLGAAGLAEPQLTLRLRDVALREVVWALFRLTGRGYVVDGDVIGNVEVEFVDGTPRELEEQLSALGVAFVGSGTIRRVAAAASAEPVLPGSGHPITLSFQVGDVRDVLRLIADVTGHEILAPTGQLGHISLFATETATADQLGATIAAAGLETRVDGARTLAFRRGEPQAPLLPLHAGGLSGHVAYRSGEPAMASQRSAGMTGWAEDELRLVGLMASAGRWVAVLRQPDGRIETAAAGQRLFDGVVDSVSGEGIVIRMEDGHAHERSLAPASVGVRLLPETLRIALDRAIAEGVALRFESAQHLLARASDLAATPAERLQVGAALSDLQFQWADDASAKGEMEAATRHLDAALAFDRVERPWQAAEDLNAIGKAWTSVGEAERAVSPHREALEIARSGAVRDAPQPFTCVRSHERTPWIEGDALDGLANAERSRGRLEEAADLYSQAVAVWKQTGDPTGWSAALTGLGLVRQQQGQLANAVALHEQALALPAPHPSVRATILNNLGSAEATLGRVDAARARFDAALALYREIGNGAGEGTVLNNLGALSETRKAPEQACVFYSEAIAASRDADDRRGVGITLGHLQRLAGFAANPAKERCERLLAAIGEPRP